MCFVLSRSDPGRKIALTADSESVRIVVDSSLMLVSDSKSWIKIISLMVSVIAMISASIDDSAADFCLTDLATIGPPAKRIRIPDVERRLSTSSAQVESE